MCTACTHCHPDTGHRVVSLFRPALQHDCAYAHPLKAQHVCSRGNHLSCHWVCICLLRLCAGARSWWEGSPPQVSVQQCCQTLTIQSCETVYSVQAVFQKCGLQNNCFCTYQEQRPQHKPSRGLHPLRVSCTRVETESKQKRLRYKALVTYSW